MFVIPCRCHTFCHSHDNGHDNGHDHGHSHSHDHGHSHDVESWQSGLLWGIVLHKYPVAMVFLSMLLNSGMRKPKAFLLLMVFGAMAPLGTLFAGAGIIGGFHKEILAIVVGIFLHVSTTILFESNEGRRRRRKICPGPARASSRRR